LKKYLLFLLISATPFTLKAQSFYDLNTIQLLEISFTQPNWDYMMDTAKAGAKGYILAEWVKINGVQIDSVGVKYKGNSSYNVNKIKNPFHIELDHFLPDNEYDGYTDIKLGNAFKDPSFVREVLTYQIARKYMAAPLSNFAKVYINGDYIGLYSNTESITKKFVDKHFFSKNNTFFKCNPVYFTNGKSNLAYLGTDSSLYFNSYEMKSVYGWNDMVNLCDILKNNPNNINSVLDIDRALWMLAIDNLFVNLDSYIGGICQNYYLYKSSNGSFNTILWDLNESFGCFSNSGEGNLNMQQLQQMTPWLHLTNTNWPLIQRLLNVPLYKRMYIEHMRTIFDDFFVNDQYIGMLNNLRTLIDADVQADPNKMYTYNQFQNALTSNVTTGMFIPGIKLLMDGRKTYLIGTTDFQHQRPQISMPVVSDTMPALNDTLIFNVQVQNANNVFIGYRYAKEDRFVRIQMFDDGLHNDGAPGDGNFGVSIPMSAIQLHYYIYAENANAGRFLPKRAEYVYLTINADIQQVFSGQLVVNELMAVNNNTITDAANQYSDWIEIYNTTGDTLNLSNIYVSDNFNIPYKWKFPDNTRINPHAYLLIWANDDTTLTGLNTPFKLSGSGERIMLSYENGIVLDSLTFPVQTADVSYGRYPNGTGSFVYMPPTPMATNVISSINNDNEEQSVKIFPNPFADNLSVIANTYIYKIEMFDVCGRTIFNQSFEKTNSYFINTSAIEKGLYFICVNDIYVVKIIKG